jgi:hypothetical protein
MFDLKSWPAVPGYSPATAKLIDRLKDGKPGDRLTDTELSQISDENCSAPLPRAHVRAATRYVLRTHYVCWQREVGENAIRCLNPHERLESAVGLRHRAGRTVNKAIQTVPLLDDVEPERRSEALALAATLGTMRQFAKAETQARMIREGITSTADIKALLAAFTK